MSYRILPDGNITVTDDNGNSVSVLGPLVSRLTGDEVILIAAGDADDWVTLDKQDAIMFANNILEWAEEA